MRLLGLVVAVAIFFGIPMIWQQAMVVQVKKQLADKSTQMPTIDSTEMPHVMTEEEAQDMQNAMLGTVDHAFIEKVQERAIEAKVREADAARADALHAADPSRY